MSLLCPVLGKIEQRASVIYLTPHVALGDMRESNPMRWPVTSAGSRLVSPPVANQVMGVSDHISALGPMARVAAASSFSSWFYPNDIPGPPFQ